MVGICLSLGRQALLEPVRVAKCGSSLGNWSLRTREVKRLAEPRLTRGHEPFEVANGGQAEFDPDAVEIEYLSPEMPEPDDSELMPYHNDQPMDGREREVMSLEEVAQLTEEGKKMGLDKVQAAGPEVHTILLPCEVLMTSTTCLLWLWRISLPFSP